MKLFCLLGFHFRTKEEGAGFAICKDCGKKITYVIRGGYIEYRGKPAEPRIKSGSIKWP